MASSTTSSKLKAEFHRSHSFLLVHEREGADDFFDGNRNPYPDICDWCHSWEFGYQLAKDWTSSMQLLSAEWSESMDRVKGADLHG